MVSGSKYGIDQPPWANPPSVSSPWPPGAWTTPSRLMKSLRTIRISCALSACAMLAIAPVVADRRDAGNSPRLNTLQFGFGDLAADASQPWRSNGLFGTRRQLDDFVSRSGPRMPTPNLPPGFDFTDPDIHAERLPVEELAELRRTAPIWWNEQPDRGGRVRRRRLLGGVQAQGRQRDLAAQRRLLQPGEHRPAPLQRGHGPRAARHGQVRAAQHGRPAAHPPAQDHLPRLHAREPSSGCATTSTSAPGGSSRPPPRRVPATSSNRCRANCRCRPSPVCWACPRKTA